MTLSIPCEDCLKLPICRTINKTFDLVNRCKDIYSFLTIKKLYITSDNERCYLSIWDEEKILILEKYMRELTKDDKIY